MCVEYGPVNVLHMKARRGRQIPPGAGVTVGREAPDMELGTKSVSCGRAASILSCCARNVLLKIMN